MTWNCFLSYHCTTGPQLTFSFVIYSTLADLHIAVNSWYGDFPSPIMEWLQLSKDKWLLQSHKHTYITWKLYCWSFCCYNWFKFQYCSGCNYHSVHKCAMMFHIWVLHFISFRLIPDTTWKKRTGKSWLWTVVALKRTTIF